MNNFKKTAIFIYVFISSIVLCSSSSASSSSQELVVFSNPYDQYTQEDYNQACDVLGVPKDATESQINNAYQDLSKQWHPYTNPTSEANNRMKEINGAYHIIQNRLSINKILQQIDKDLSDNDMHRANNFPAIRSIEEAQTVRKDYKKSIKNHWVELYKAALAIPKNFWLLPEINPLFEEFKSTKSIDEQIIQIRNILDFIAFQTNQKITELNNLVKKYDIEVAHGTEELFIITNPRITQMHEEQNLDEKVKKMDDILQFMIYQRHRRQLLASCDNRLLFKKIATLGLGTAILDKEQNIQNDLSEKFLHQPINCKGLLPEIEKTLKEQEKLTVRAGYAATGTVLAVLGVAGLVGRFVFLDK